MSGEKYIIRNDNTTNAFFNYQRYDNQLWQYQIQLSPGQTRTIWAVKDTFIPTFGNLKITILDSYPFPTSTPTSTN